MRRSHFYILFLLSSFLVSCAPSSTGARFIYMRMEKTPTLVILDGPQSASPLGEMPLETPPSCSFWSLTPAPHGPFAALEWQCPFGQFTQLVDVTNKRVSALFDDPKADSHLLGWSADGKQIFLKTSMNSDPKILQVNVESRLPTVLTISPNTYSITTSPENNALIWAFSDGLHLGSQIWGANASGNRPQIIFSDPGHIIGFMRFSPDGKHIAAIRTPDSTDEFPAGALWLVDSDGKHARFAAIADGGRGMFPVWSPSGEKIAYIGRNQPEDPSSINLSIFTLSGFKPEIINLNPVLPPVWSLDGNGLYVTLPADGKMNVWFYEIASGKRQKLFENACCVGWIK